MIKKLIHTACLTLFVQLISLGQGYQLAVLKYSGGGDYYANPTALPNLISFCNENLGTTINKEVPYVEVGSSDLFQYPFIHMTGHGNVVFSSSESTNLRTYLLGGGFLHIDDNYGMNEFIRVELKKVFPSNELVELPFNHELFHQKYDFNGLPKIHEHDGKRPQAFGIIIDGRLVCLYTYETDLSDGWENREVHNDSENKRIQALKMGANILMHAFMQ
ncbi:MAG: DUF4159 domain-containing protein [Crocinitomicaceae bacterium]|nr:DUF4159 domain-containing protein [Crocinitomicaceae bacterium]MDG1775941.1 DUF4159 domain-containing protein [Crocinitomicaceae bacterium]